MKPAMSFQSSARRAARQAGFTLVEMMVALAIGLVVALGFAVSFVNLKTTFTTQDKLSQLQDNERLALAFLTASVEQAGYFPNPTSNTRTTAMPQYVTADDATYGTTVAGQFLMGMPPNGSIPESLSTLYASATGDGLLTCQGGTNGTTGTIVIRNVFFVDATTHALGCQAYVNGSTTTAPGATFQPLISNVSSMSVLYSVDTNADGYADTYMTANTVTANNHWPDVKAVQVTLNFLNPNPGGATITWVQAINLMNNR
jgi:type IV pilus assembly protein PilW